MGTRFDLVLPGIDEITGDLIFGMIHSEVNRVENLLSNYEDSSTLSVLNKSAFQSDFHTDNELFDLICKIKNLNSACMGFFDVTCGIFPGSENGIPFSDIQAHAFSAGMDEIIINSQNNSIRFAKNGISINSGGFGKGYALEKVKNILYDKNITQAFVSFGESSVLALGNHPFGQCWKISIPDIYSADSIYVFNLKNECLSVSGNTPANRNKYPEGHIINPLTGKLVTRPGVVCVSGPSAFEAEILSTAIFAAGEDEQKQIIRNFSAYKAVCISYSFDSSVPIVKEIV
jgi:thiamine biosynthesis lipoprotein